MCGALLESIRRNTGCASESGAFGFNSTMHTK